MDNTKAIEFNKNEVIAGIVIKLIAILASVYGLYMSIYSAMSFTYFTNLSNILIDIVLLIFLVSDIMLLLSKENQKNKKNWLYIVKYMATISITITFLIYLTLLAPTNKLGFINAYLNNSAGSLCLHFITPLLAIFDFMLFDYKYSSNKAHAVFATIPPLLYVVFVVIAASCGMRWKVDMYAPYNFLNFGAETGWFGFDLSQLGSKTLGVGVAYMIVVLLLIFIGIGELYLMMKNKRRKSRMK